MRTQSHHLSNTATDAGVWVFLATGTKSSEASVRRLDRLPPGIREGEELHREKWAEQRATKAPAPLAKTTCVTQDRPWGYAAKAIARGP
jgi:hypothetical protein